MNNTESVLVDSDFWLAFYLKSDSNSDKASEVFKKLESASVILITTSVVVGEVATVLSHREGKESVLKFLDWVYESGLQVIHISEELHQQGITILTAQNKRGTSYVDCTNVAVMKMYGFKYICAFDKTYHKNFGLNNVCYNTPT